MFMLVAGTVAGLLATVTYMANRSLERLSQELINRTASQAESALQEYLAPARSGLTQLEFWSQSGTFDPDQTDRSNALIVPMMLAYPQLGIVTTGDVAGHHFMLRREGDVFVNREMRPTAPKRAIVSRFKNGALGLVQLDRVDKDLDFDHRDRPWFKNAINRAADQEPYWTKPYLAHDSKEPIVTLAKKLLRPNGEPYVAAVHLFLRDLSLFTERMSPSKNGATWIMDDGRKLLGLPAATFFVDEAARQKAVLSRPDPQGAPVLAVAVDAWKAQAKPLAPIRIEHDGEAYWAGFRRVLLNDKRGLWIGTMIPEADFRGDVRSQQYMTLFIGFFALCVATFFSRRIARGYSRVIERLVEQTERLRELRTGERMEIQTRLVEVHRLATAHEQMRRALDAFARYVPTDLVRELLRQDEAAKLGVVERRLTVFFSDIRGFTTIAESMSPTDLTDQLAEYFAAMLEELNAQNATIDKFIGDAIMAFWGAPTAINAADHATCAVRAAMGCQARLAVLNRKWAQQPNRRALPTRIGLATGSVMVGNVGAPERLNYTLVGDTANLASRLEGANRFFGTTILVSEAVALEAGGAFEFREVDRIAVKGKNASVLVFEPIGVRGQVDPERLSFSVEYEAALGAYRGRSFDEAIARLDRLDERVENDESVARLRRACKVFRETPPPEGWQGETHLDEK